MRFAKAAALVEGAVIEVAGFDAEACGDAVADKFELRALVGVEGGARFRFCASHLSKRAVNDSVKDSGTGCFSRTKRTRGTRPAKRLTTERPFTLPGAVAANATELSKLAKSPDQFPLA